jgi:hypothetical protein
MQAIEMAIRGLSNMDGLVITVMLQGGFRFEWNGITYDGSCLPNEEAFINAYIHIRARQDAKWLVESAKVVLPG